MAEQRAMVRHEAIAKEEAARQLRSERAVHILWQLRASVRQRELYGMGSRVLVWRLSMIAAHFDAMVTKQLKEAASGSSTALEKLQNELKTAKTENEELREERHPSV